MELSNQIGLSHLNKSMIDLYDFIMHLEFV